MDLTLEFDHYAIFVDDLARSAEFYRTVLGLQEIADPFQDGRHIWFRVGRNQQVHIITPRGAETRPTTDVHFAFRVSSVAEFAAHLASAGVDYGAMKPDREIVTRPDGIRQIYFQDPDGHWLEANEARC
jgi:lactoylglutathione lyase